MEYLRKFVERTRTDTIKNERMRLGKDSWSCVIEKRMIRQILEKRERGRMRRGRPRIKKDRAG